MAHTWYGRDASNCFAGVPNLLRGGMYLISKLDVHKDERATVEVALCGKHVS